MCSQWPVLFKPGYKSLRLYLHKNVSILISTVHGETHPYTALFQTAEVTVMLLSHEQNTM